MANDWGSNPWILDTGSYTTGTVSITKDTRAVTGSGTAWDATNCPVTTTLNRDILAEILFSDDSYATAFTIGVRGSTTALTLEALFTRTTVSGGSHKTRRLYLPNVKISSIFWTGAANTDTLKIYDRDLNLVIDRVSDGSDNEVLSVPQWFNGFTLDVIDGGTIYVYRE